MPQMRGAANVLFYRINAMKIVPYTSICIHFYLEQENNLQIFTYVNEGISN